MTREDINDIISAICPNDEDYEKPCISPKYLRQELEQLALDQRQWNKEPTTKNDLGVDWEELKIKIFMEVDGGTDDNWLRYGEVCDRISNSIDDFKANLPSVTPQEPKTGHWILTDVEGNRVWHCNCSECGKDPQDYIGGSENWWLIKNKLPKFCPNCGAKMEAEDNG